MNDIDIFKKVTPSDGTWFSFKEVGDNIQGTYVDVRSGTDGFGNQQSIYILVDAEGKVWNLGFRQTAAVIHDRMKDVKFGQIVGFRYDEARDSKRSPGTKVKIIRVYADPKVVNEEWVKDHSDKASTSTLSVVDTTAPAQDLNYGYDDKPADPNEPPFEAPKGAGATSGGVPSSSEDGENKAVQAIHDLAISKGLVKADATKEEQKEIIEKYSDLPLTEENLTKIIIKLTGYKSE